MDLLDQLALTSTAFDSAFLGVAPGIGIAPAIASILKSLIKSRSPVRQSEGGDILLNDRRHRLATGIRKIGDSLVPTVFVETDQGPAYDQATKTASQSHEEMRVEVLGTAHSGLLDSKSSIQMEDLLPGISVSHEDGLAGTLGAFISFRYRRKKGDFIGFTSASHVFGILTAKSGDPIVSPGWPDRSPDIADRIGTLGRCIHLTHYTTQNQLDAIIYKTDIAAAELNLDRREGVSNRVPKPGGDGETIVLHSPMDDDDLVEHLEKPVFMIGRTSGFNEGILHATGVQPYSIKIGQRIYLYGDIGVVRPQKGSTKSFSQPGDSGAPIYSQEGRLLGFVVAGAGGKGLFQPAYKCLAEIDAKLV
jgi:hypothetical protein